MSTFVIEGGHKLSGNITPQGAKNEALQVICAVLLTKDKVTISNIPDIRDVNKLIYILGELGVKVEKIKIYIIIINPIIYFSIEPYRSSIQWCTVVFQSHFGINRCFCF